MTGSGVRHRSRAYYRKVTITKKRSGPSSISQFIETLLIRIETDEGLYGWGESQAPVGPEVVKNIIDRLLVPLILGSDPRQTGVLWERMYHSMYVRGQITGFMLDAISGVDMALWDIKGKAAGASVASCWVDLSALGFPFTSQG